MNEEQSERTIASHLLARALELTGANLGNVQLLDWDSGQLAIVAQHGFGPDFLRYFARVSAASSCACGVALDQRRATVIEDVLRDESFRPHREIAIEAGFRAVQSTPMISSSGALVGIVSTHFPAPHRPSTQELLSLRWAAGRAANCIMDLRVRARPSDAQLMASSREAINRSLELLARIPGPSPWPELPSSQRRKVAS